METVIKVLMLEDNANDAALIQKTLERAHVPAQTRLVSTREAFVQALDDSMPDIILSDHQLPQFSSPEALHLAHAKYPFVPFILVTGTVSEEFAAAIIRSGADDYLLKNNLKRLPTAVHQAIEKKRTEKSLIESNERYELVSKATSDAIWDWDLQTDKIVWNHGLKTLFGHDYTETTATSEWLRNQLHPDDHDRVVSEVGKVFKDRSDSWVSFYRFKHVSGDYRHVFDRAHIIYQNGRAIRMIGAMQDVNDRLKMLEEVKRLSIVASKTDNSVLIMDKDMKIEWVNDSFTKLTGYTLKEAIGRPSFEFLHGPDTDPFVLQRIVQKAQLLKPFTDEMVNYSKAGRRYWVRMTVTPVLTMEGEIDKFVTIQTDITAQKEFENNITAIARELSTLIENSNAPIFGVDRNGYINEWNKITAELTGYTRNEVLGKKWANFLAPEVHEKVSSVLRNVLDGHPATNYQLPTRSKNGKELILSISMSARYDSNKNVKGAICVGQDITELLLYRRDLERMVDERTRDLNEALKKEKELVEMKSKFVSIASHEFRTPLSTISFAAESIRNYFHQLSIDEINRKLIKIEDQASHMTNLLEDILTIGKSEAGKIKLKRVSLDLKEFIESLVEEVKVGARQQREIQFRYSYPRTKISIDDKLLRNIVSNLLTNAIKFSEPQSLVRVSVSGQNGVIIIEVADQGIGIAEQELGSIFESFQRGSNASNIQGTGLGLSILKKAVELMGGTISVKSRLNEGSVFTVKIPDTAP